MTTNTTNTTNHLYIAPRDRVLLWLRWHRQNVLYGLVALAWLVTLLLVSRTLSGPPSARTAAVPTPALPITPASIIIIASPVPTVQPQPTATPDTRVFEELAALRAEVAALREVPPPAPQVIYQVVNQPVDAAPTVDAEQYTVANQPPAPTMAPQQAAILDRNAWAAQAAEQRGRP